MSKDQFQIVRLNEDNLNLLVPLFKAAFGVDENLDDLKIKYNTRDVFGLYTIGFVACVEGNAVAYYGVFPCYFYLEGRRVLCAQSGDTMTHPEFQGKGLFTLLAKKTYEEAMKEGVSFIWGIPNEKSLPGFVKKLDWRILDKLHSYRIKITGLPISKVAYRNRITKSIFEQWFNGFFKEFVKEGKKFQISVNGADIFDDYWTKKSSRKIYEFRQGNDYLLFKYSGFIWIGYISSNPLFLIKDFLRKNKLKFKFLGVTEIRIYGNATIYLDLENMDGFKVKESLSVGVYDPHNHVQNKIELYGFEFDTF